MEEILCTQLIDEEDSEIEKKIKRIRGRRNRERESEQD